MITTIILCICIILSVNTFRFLLTYLLQSYFYYICLPDLSKLHNRDKFEEIYKSNFNAFIIWLFIVSILWSIFYYLTH